MTDADKIIEVLLVEDDEVDYLIFKNYLGQINSYEFKLDWVKNLNEACKAITGNKYDVYILDYRLGPDNALNLLKYAKSNGCTAPFIMLTGQNDRDIDLEAMQSGAAGYLVKGEFDTALLERSIRYAIKHTTVLNSLASEKNRLHVTLKSIADGVVTTDTNGRIVSMNPTAEVMTGWTNDEACDKELPDVLNLVSEQNNGSRGNPALQIIKTRAPLKPANNTMLVHKNGSKRVVMYNGAPIQDENDALIGVVIIFHDLTDKIKLEEELFKANKLESVGMLAGGIAHDFNNLMSIILGNTQLAQMHLEDAREIKQELNKIAIAGKRAKQLTNQLLAFAKGGQPVKKVASLIPVIKEAVALSFSGSKIDYVLTLSENLWQVEVDETQIVQVFNNLFMNAQEAMPNGGTVKITTANKVVTQKKMPTLEDGKYVKITVADQGVGIPEEHLSKIFDAYFTTRKNINKKGHGLGLTSCYSVIRRHGGTITVESSPGKGATFFVYLPASVKKSGITIPDDLQNLRGHGKILVMDDEEMLLELAEKLLSKLGYEVTTAKDGADALRLYQHAHPTKEQFDLVVLDLTVPGGMGGKETLAKLREINPEAKAIACSGYSNDMQDEIFTKSKFNAFVAKPYDIGDLNNIILKIIDSDCSIHK